MFLHWYRPVTILLSKLTEYQGLGVGLSASQIGISQSLRACPRVTWRGVKLSLLITPLDNIMSYSPVNPGRVFPHYSEIQWVAV